MFGRDGEVRKALPSVCFANNRLCSASPREFEPLKGIIATSKKEIPKGISFLLCKGYKKDIFAGFAYEFEPSQFLHKNIPLVTS